MLGHLTGDIYAPDLRVDRRGPAETRRRHAYRLSPSPEAHMPPGSFSLRSEPGYPADPRGRESTASKPFSSLVCGS